MQLNIDKGEFAVSGWDGVILLNCFFFRILLYCLDFVGVKLSNSVSCLFFSLVMSRWEVACTPLVPRVTSL